MTTIFILQGVHFHVPGNQLSAHATKASADIEAASLVNEMLEWIELPQDAKPETWEADLLRARKARAEQMGCDDPDDLGDDDCDVWITELPLVGEEAASEAPFEAGARAAGWTFDEPSNEYRLNDTGDGYDGTDANKTWKELCEAHGINPRP